MTRPEDLPAEEEAARRGSPAAAVALLSAVLAVGTAFNPSAPAVSLFFALVALAALPMGLADRRDLVGAPRRRADTQLLAAAVLTAGALLALGTAFLSGE